MSEHTEQAALFQWAALHAARLPELMLLYAVPNGGLRHPAVAARLKEEGLKPGVPDVVLPVARLGFHGFYQEMKVGRNKPTSKQTAWLNALSEQGYAVDVSYSWIEAARKFARYLGAEPGEVGL